MTFKLPTLLVALFSICTLGLRAGEKASDGAIHVNAVAAAKLVEEKKVVVLDVRTADEFKDGHIEGAQNLDFLKSGEFKAQIEKLDKTKTYLVHCQAGGRSGKSLKIFKELGFENVYHMDDGFGGWEDAKLPVTK
jgi:rhodanese-related sulfurtransferase